MIFLYSLWYMVAIIHQLNMLESILKLVKNNMIDMIIYYGNILMEIMKVL